MTTKPTDLSWDERVDLTRRLLVAMGESLAGRPQELEALVKQHRIAERNRAEAAKFAALEVPARRAARRPVTLPARLAALHPARLAAILSAVDDVIGCYHDDDEETWVAAMDRFDAGVRAAAEGD